jgi:hypothetical protein
LKERLLEARQILVYVGDPPKNMVIILLETNEKCKSNQWPTTQACGVSNPNHKKDVKPT